MIPVLPDLPASPLDLFLALVQIPSPSQSEGRVAKVIQDWLRKCGVRFTVDNAWEVTGGDTGNLIVRSFRSPEKPTVLFVAHLDTVEREKSVIQPIVGEDGIVRSSGDTILAADNKAGVAALLSLLTRGRDAHANAVFVFSTCEERGRMGVTALSDLAAEVDFAFPVDGSDPVGTVFEAALGQVPFDLRVNGREAHAAKEPDNGVHAVKAACDVVSRLKMGWSGDSLLNVSQIRGGSETNVIPGYAEICGEVRAFTAEAIDGRLREVESVAATIGNATGATLELQTRPEDGAPPFPPGRDRQCLSIAGAAANDVGLKLSRKRCMATLEANFLSGMGMPTLGMASGGRHPHSVNESLPVDELTRLVALLDAILVRAAKVGDV